MADSLSLALYDGDTRYASPSTGDESEKVHLCHKCQHLLTGRGMDGITCNEMNARAENAPTGGTHAWSDHPPKLLKDGPLGGIVPGAGHTRHDRPQSEQVKHDR
jgi:hypothetical protein